MNTSKSDMPMLKAFLRREVSAQVAINLATYLDEALEIIRAASVRVAYSDAHPNAPGVR